MRIGLLTTSFPREDGDPAGSFVLGFARALASRGHTLEVLAPEPHEGRFARAPEYPNVRVHWVRYLAPRALQQTFYGAGVLDNVRMRPTAALGVAPFTAALAAAMVRRRGAWDAVVSHWALPCAVVAGELRGARPHLAVLHSGDVFLLEQLPLRAQLAQRIARRSDALLFSTRDLRRRFLGLIPPLARAELSSRASVCAMGIEPRGRSDEARATLRARLGLRHFTVLSLGRLVPIKGLHHAIAATAQLADVELVIAGYGPERDSLEAEARARNARVRFVGPLWGVQKDDFMRAADAFVVPSIVLANGRCEGMPNTILEAMEHGLPVVASDVGGISDVVRHGENGLLVEPAQPEALARALQSLSDRSLRTRLSKAARATAALYHWSELAPEIEALFLGAK